MSRFLRLAGAALACATSPLLAAAPWPAPVIAERYVQEALQQNLGLQTQGEDIAAARARLDLAAGARQPRVDLIARYSRAEGGRTIDVPAGDLLNPVYATLNELLVAQGRSPAFPSVANLEIPLLREREQGSGLYSPLAIVIIGGLISSLLLSRVVTPVVYSLLPPPIPKAG